MYNISLEVYFKMKWLIEVGNVYSVSGGVGFCMRVFRLKGVSLGVILLFEGMVFIGLLLDFLFNGYGLWCVILEMWFWVWLERILKVILKVEKIVI